MSLIACETTNKTTKLNDSRANKIIITLSNIHDSRDLSSIDRINISTLFKTTLDVVDGKNNGGYSSFHQI